MAFTRNLERAARRHLEAGFELASGKRRDVAGYLFGIAAECALKAMMHLDAVRDKEAFYAHFPELKTLLRDAIGTRRAKTLATFVYDATFMNNWSVGMRYSDGTQIRKDWVEAWRKQAALAVSAMGT